MHNILKAIFGHRSDTLPVQDELLASGYSRTDTTLSSMLPTEQAGRHAARVEESSDDNVGAGVPGAATDGSENRPVYPSGTEPGALQSRAHEDSHYFGTQPADAPPAGNTFKETMGAGSQWGDPDDGRLHVPTVALRTNSGGVSRDTDSPSYRYGAEMRNGDKYRNRSWDEAEPSLKSGWETLASDTPAWDASKPAIRRGWDEVTPEIDDDSYYRNHWTTRYANSDGDRDYDDYEPAYVYGSEARRSEKYRSRDWRDVEPHLKADWETRHAGRLSSWDNFKDAVKHGWHGISPDMDGKDTAQLAHEPSHARGDGIGDDPVAVSFEGESERAHAGSASPPWDRVKAAVRNGWDRVMS